MEANRGNGYAPAWGSLVMMNDAPVWSIGGVLISFSVAMSP